MLIDRSHVTFSLRSRITHVSAMVLLQISGWRNATLILLHLHGPTGPIEGIVEARENEPVNAFPPCIDAAHTRHAQSHGCCHSCGGRVREAQNRSATAKLDCPQSNQGWPVDEGRRGEAKGRSARHHVRAPWNLRHFLDAHGRNGGALQKTGPRRAIKRSPNANDLHGGWI